MATLTNTQISVTYVGLLKTSANTVLTSTAQQITDGSGNNSIMFLSTAGVGIGGSPASGKELDVTGNVQVTGDLIVDNITIDGSTITNASGNLTIVNTVDDGDIIFQSDDGSGGVTEYFRADGSSENVLFSKLIKMSDNVEIRLGDGNDLKLNHDGTDSFIRQTGSGDLYITQEVDDKDLIFQCDDASGGVTTYFKLDGSAGFTVVSKKFRFEDNVNLTLGASDDLSLFHDGTDSTIKNDTGDLIIKNNADDKDIIFRSDDGSGGTAEYFKISGSTESIITSKSNFFGDNVKAIFGAGSDLQIFHNGSHSFIQDQGTGDLRILSSKVEIFNAAASETMAKFTEDSAVELYHNGSKKFETSSTGVTISNNLTLGSTSATGALSLPNNGEINLFNANDDNKFTIRNTGSALNTLSIELNDGTDALTIASDGDATFVGDVSLADSKKIKVGNSSDLEIYHDGSNSYIQDTGTGGLRITSDVFRVLDTTNAEVMIKAEANAAVELYHNNSKTFETISNGVRILSGSGTGGNLSFGSAGGTGTIEPNQASGTNESGGSLQLYGGRSTGNAAGGDIQFYVVPAGTSGSSVNSPSQVMHIEASSQNIGIGTTSPSATLEVAKGSEGDYLIVGGDNSSNGRALVFSSSTATSNGAKHTIRAQSGNGQIAFKTGTTEALLLDSSQNATFAGNVAVGDGSASSPSITFSGDTDTGIFRTASNAINFGTNGAERMRLTNTGLGIGTTSPAIKLDVDAGASDNVARFTSTDSNARILIADNDDIMYVGTQSNQFYIGPDDSATGNNLIIDSSGNATFAGNISLADSGRARFGAGGDFAIYHNGTDTFLDNSTGDLKIRNFADDKDIIFQSDDGSGGVTEYFKLDGSHTRTTFAKDIKLEDSVKILVGTGEDLEIFHDGNSVIRNQTADLFIDNYADDGDITFRTDDGTGSVTEYMRLDGGNSNIIVSKEMRFGDGVQAQFGASNHLQVQHNSSDGSITNATGNLTIQNSADDSDIIFRSDDGSGGTTPYMTLDGSSTSIVITASTGMYFNDSIKARFGTSGDMTIFHDGTDSKIENLTGDLTIQNGANDKDIVFNCDDGSGGTAEYMRIDGSQESIRMKRITKWDDSIKATFGDSTDLQIYHDGTNSYVEQTGTGDIIIRNSTDDKDILLQTDNGSGNVTSYIQLDGSDLSTKILTQKVILSNLPTSDPNNAGQLYNESGFLRVSAG